MSLRFAINGFGRIGRNIIRLAATNPAVACVGINDLFDLKTIAHLLKYDSIFGVANFPIEVTDNALVVNGKRIPVTAEKNPAALPWKTNQVDIAFECTGHFTDRESAAAHLTAGARKVIVSAPAKNADLTCVYGVNHQSYDPAKHDVISNASCTTNCLAPIAKVLHESFGIENGFVTTIHSYTNDQRLMDAPHADPRRARAATLSQIPTTTGAAKAVGLVLPELKGKLDGIAIRVPTPNVSCLDLVANLKKTASVADINAALRAAAHGPLKNILRFCEEPLVSVDFLGDPHSSIVDSACTAVIGNMVKVISWYDNEVGFSQRMLDVAQYIGSR